MTRLVQTKVRVQDKSGVTLIPNDLSEQAHELHHGYDERATSSTSEFSAPDPDHDLMEIRDFAHSPSSSSGWEMDSPGGRHSRQIHARKRHVSNL